MVDQNVGKNSEQVGGFYENLEFFRNSSLKHDHEMELYPTRLYSEPIC
jgi:hypothetical protein